MNTLNPKCKICDEGLSKGGIFAISLDPFYLLVDDKKVNNNYHTIAYHSILDFFVEEISDSNEKILKQNFYHTECAPHNIKIKLPAKEIIKKYWYSGDIGNRIQVELSVEEARKSRIPGRPISKK